MSNTQKKRNKKCKCLIRLIDKDGFTFFINQGVIDPFVERITPGTIHPVQVKRIIDGRCKTCQSKM